MRRKLSRLLASQRFDTAYIHLFRMAPYLEEQAPLYRIIDLTDVISREIEASLAYRALFSRILYSLERFRIAAYESEVAKTADEVWLISGSDARVLAERCPQARIEVVPSGVASDRFFPMPGIAEASQIAFVGHLGVLHNVDAAEHLAVDIFPLIRRKVPACSLRIIGAEPARRVRALGSRPGVEVTGFVADLHHELNRAAVIVAPLRFAAGVQTKVLEAMAAARPVVTTPRVSEGLGATPGKHLLVGDSRVELADQVVALLEDETLRRQIGGEGLLFVRERYTWDRALRRCREVEEGLKLRKTAS
jgi:glycosyltransferase involved in cell wall biosynthesis